MRRLSLLLLAAMTMTMTSVLVRGMSTPGKQKVAIIGGGIAGLSCAQHLADGSGKYDVTVYDTGRLRPGGRCSTRQSGDKPKDNDAQHTPLLSKYRYDHAAQLISADNNNPMLEDFKYQLAIWEHNGVLTKFPAKTVGRISKDGKIQTFDKQQVFFHGTHGMGGIPTSFLKNKNFNLEQDVWVSPSNGVQYQKSTGKWKLQADGKQLGIFDQLIIAHNGKCADRIMSKTPAKDVHWLLRVNFSPTVPAHGGKKMTLNSIYSLTILVDKNTSPRFSKSIPEPMISAFCDHPRLRMITCQTRKYPDQEGASDGQEVWTILSSSKFAKKYKAPQEFLPEETIEEVSCLLLEGVEELLDLSAGSIKPVEKRLQLWGAAVPLNTWSNSQGFIYDPTNNVGVCGDWLVEPSVAGAWTSGAKLANHMLTNAKEKTGLDGKFERSESSSKLGIASLSQI